MQREIQLEENGNEEETRSGQVSCEMNEQITLFKKTARNARNQDDGGIQLRRNTNGNACGGLQISLSA